MKEVKAHALAQYNHCLCYADVGTILRGSRNFEIEKDKKNMISRFKCMPPGMVAVFCSLLLAILLVACGDGTTSTSSATPTSKPSPTATPTPALTVYTGKGYSIGYPQGWKVTPSG